MRSPACTAPTCGFSGADDGIRTRDPHLGKVPWTGSVTCGDGRIWAVNRVFSVSCNRDGSRRFPFVDGTPTGLQRPTPGAQIRERTVAPERSEPV